MVSEPLSSPDQPGWWLLRKLDFVELCMFPSVLTQTTIPSSWACGSDETIPQNKEGQNHD